MSVNYYDKDTGELVPIAKGTLYADAPVGAIQAYGGTTAPTGWLLCQGQAVSRTTYAELFAIIGTAFGTGDGSTTFNIPDYRGKVPFGADANNAIGTDENGALPNIKGGITGMRAGSGGTANGCVQTTGSAENVSTWSGSYGGWNIDASRSSTLYKDGQTTVVPANVRVNYIIKAKQVSVPADFIDAVDDLIKDTTVDAVTNGDMHAVTSNAVYDEFQKVQSRTYEGSGFIINSSAGEITGYGRVSITLKNGIAEIKFSARINTNTMTSTFNWGLNRDLLKILLPDIPYITPISNNSNLIFFAPTGAVFIDNMGFGAMASATNQFWTPARMYQTDGSTGTWGSDQFPVNSYITGTVYGAYTV